MCRLLNSVVCSDALIVCFWVFVLVILLVIAVCVDSLLVFGDGPVRLGCCVCG